MSDREQNRRRFPGAAKTVDTYREAFGDDTKLVRAVEDGPEGRVYAGKWTEEEKAALPVQFPADWAEDKSVRSARSNVPYLGKVRR